MIQLYYHNQLPSPKQTQNEIDDRISYSMEKLDDLKWKKKYVEHLPKEIKVAYIS